MGVSILTVVAILVLAIIVFRRGPDEVTVSNKQAKWVLRGALVLMGIYAVFWLFFGISEMISGDLSGVIHLVPAIMLVVLMFLARRLPVEGGVVLVILGVLASAYYIIAAIHGGGSFQVTSILVGGVPYLVFGLIFLGRFVFAVFKWR
jgi:hypothetical protein